MDYHLFCSLLLASVFAESAKAEGECNYTSQISIESRQSEAPLPVTIVITVNRSPSDVNVTVVQDDVAEILQAANDEALCSSVYVYSVDTGTLTPSISHYYTFSADETIPPFEQARTTVEISFENEPDDDVNMVAAGVAISILFFVILVGMAALLVVCCWKRSFDAKRDRENEYDTETHEQTIYSIPSSISTEP